MTYFDVSIQSKQYPNEGVVHVRVLANSWIEANDHIIATMRENGVNTDEYVLSIREAISEKDLNKAEGQTCSERNGSGKKRTAEILDDDKNESEGK